MRSKKAIIYSISKLLVSAFVAVFVQTVHGQTAENHVAAASVREPFISKEGRFSIVMPAAFAPVRQNSFRSVSSWGDPMTVTQFMSYPLSTPALQVYDPPTFVLAMYVDYSASLTAMGYNRELLEIVHKATLRRFPEYSPIRTERAYWRPRSGHRTPTERLADAAVAKSGDAPVITTFAKIRGTDRLVRADSYLVGRRIYWVIAVYAASSGFEKTAAAGFCDSFRLIGG